VNFPNYIFIDILTSLKKITCANVRIIFTPGIRRTQLALENTTRKMDKFRIWKFMGLLVMRLQMWGNWMICIPCTSFYWLCYKRWLYVQSGREFKNQDVICIPFRLLEEVEEYWWCNSHKFYFNSFLHYLRLVFILKSYIISSRPFRVHKVNTCTARKGPFHHKTHLPDNDNLCLLNLIKIKSWFMSMSRNTMRTSGEQLQIWANSRISFLKL